MRDDQPLDSLGALQMHLDGGYISRFFVTEVADDGEEIAVLEDPLILVVEEKLSSLERMLPLLESIVQSGQPLLIIGGGVEGHALNTLVWNKTRGGLKGAAVEVLCCADQRRAILKDIARLTGGILVERNLGIGLENINVSMLGKAKKVRIEENKTVILGGAGRPLRPKAAASTWGGEASPAEKQPPESTPEAPRRRRGPRPGEVDRFGGQDRALYPVIKSLMQNDKLTLTAATQRLAEEGKIAGNTREVSSLAARLRRRYTEDHKLNPTRFH